MEEKAKKLLYVPILKAKTGERWALSHLKAATKVHVRPLLELHAHKTKPRGDHVESLCEELEADWGINRSLYLDGIWLHGDTGNPAVLDEIFSSAISHGLRAIPVVRSDFDNASLEQVQDIVESTGRGYLLRFRPDDLANPGRINNVVETVGIARNRVDLLLDYRAVPMNLPHDLPRIPNASDWRNLIASSGVFPRSLTDYSLHVWHHVPRNDWTSWTDGIAAGLLRDPIFSDYTMRAPGAPSDFGDPPVALRYTTDANWLVRIDGRHRAGDAPEMKGQCASLVERDEFRDEDFSEGDAEIIRISDPDEEETGGPTQWLQWSVNHHIEFVVRQLLGDV